MLEFNQDEYPNFIYTGISWLKTMSRKIIAEAYLNPLKKKPYRKKTLWDGLPILATRFCVNFSLRGFSEIGMRSRRMGTITLFINR